MASDFDFAARAAATRDAHDAFHTAFSRVTHRTDDDHPLTQRWTAALAAFGRAKDDTFPGGFWNAWTKVKGGDLSDLENLVAFLEADPWFAESGYFKALIMRRLKRVELAADIVARLVVVIERRLRDGPGTQEYKHYIRLGRTIARPYLIGVAAELDPSADRRTAIRARDALRLLEFGRGDALR